MSFGVFSILLKVISRIFYLSFIDLKQLQNKPGIKLNLAQNWDTWSDKIRHPSIHIHAVCPWWHFSKKKPSLAQVYLEPEHLTLLKNTKNTQKQKKANEMGGHWEPSYLISINGFTGDPRGASKSLCPGFRPSPLWKNERNGLVYDLPSGFYCMFD